MGMKINWRTLFLIICVLFNGVVLPFGIRWVYAQEPQSKTKGSAFMDQSEDWMDGYWKGIYYIDHLLNESYQDGFFCGRNPKCDGEHQSMEELEQKHGDVKCSTSHPDFGAHYVRDHKCFTGPCNQTWECPPNYKLVQSTSKTNPICVWQP